MPLLCLCLPDAVSTKLEQVVCPEKPKGPEHLSHQRKHTEESMLDPKPEVYQAVPKGDRWDIRD